MSEVDTEAAWASLRPEDLLAAAASEAGLEDQGDDELTGYLTRYVTAAVEEGRLSAIGVFGVQAFVHRILVNRLRFAEDLKRHPQILEEDVHDPIVLTGLPRTGTTKLQRMMGADPALRPLAFWRLLNPAPFPGAKPGDADPRIAIGQAYEAQMAMLPDFMAGHSMRALEPEEEGLLMDMTFESPTLGTRLRAPSSHLTWAMDHPQDRTYDYLRRMVQYLQWQDGGRGGRPLLLKTPMHLGTLDLLARTFPGVTVVHCHRDPVVALASITRLFEVSQLFTEDIDLQELGSQSLRLWSDAMTKYMAHRDALGDHVEIVDANYSDIERDPTEIIREVHRRRDQTVTPEREQIMAAWDAENPQHRFGKHIYSLERYGLTEESVREAFGPYIERFIRESSAP